MKLKNIKAVIFDLDGTLIDSMGLWKNIDLEFLSKRNLFCPDNLQEQINGLSMYETAEFFKKKYQLSDSCEMLMKEWTDMAYMAYRNEIPLKPGAYEFIKNLKTNHILTGIATSNAQTLVTASLLHHQLQDDINEIVTANEVDHGKPFPDVFLECARRLQVLPKDCLVFEDLLEGIEAAHSAGMQVISIYDDYTREITDEKIKQSDDYILNYYDDILKF